MMQRSSLRRYNSELLAALRLVNLPHCFIPHALLFRKHPYPVRTLVNESKSMGQWVRLAAVEEIPDGSGKEFVVGDRILAVYHTEGAYWALDGVCPHAGGPLAQGRLNGSIVTCPWHGWQFDIQTGRHCLNSNLSQPRFPVKVEGAEVWVEVP